MNASNSNSPSAHPSRLPEREALLRRLERLQAYLQNDPENTNLQVDIFETAVAAGAWDVAENQVEHAKKTLPDPTGWQFRYATLCIAQAKYEEAKQALHDLEGIAGPHPGIAHNLAYIAFAQSRYQECAKLLQPWVDGSIMQSNASALLDPALQVLWLRSLHRSGALDDAWRWVGHQKTAGTLTDEAAGVASLIAIDADYLQEALSLSEQALSKIPRQMEALVARATIALAQRDVATARHLLNEALSCNSHDGRSWSALGFAEMLDMNIEKAKAHFQQAVHWMATHIGTWHGLGWACLLLRDMEGAKEAFERALALDGNFAESHGGMAVVMATKGMKAQAEDHIKVAIRLDKSNLSARYAQAILKGEASDTQSIRRLAEHLMRGRAAPLGGEITDWLHQ